MIRIKIISIIALLGLALAVSAQCPLRIKGGDAVSVGLYIAPVDRTAMPVVEHDSGRLLTPASIMKSLTMATALELLGPDFRWNTRVMAHGNLSHDGTLNGDIVIIGSGDPTLESRHFKEHPSFVASLVNAVKAHGIKTIRGKSGYMMLPCLMAVLCPRGKWRILHGTMVPAHTLLTTPTILLHFRSHPCRFIRLCPA